MKYSFIVIGGGIVGLATAYKLLQKFPAAKLLLLEKEKGVAQHQTGRNSGVIHSGIYYKPGSYKAQLCREGYRQLIAFCQVQNIPYDICGKIIVATESEQIPELDKLWAKAQANGLKGCRRLTQNEIKNLEPSATGIAGLHVPETGIVNYLTVSEKLAQCILQLGGAIHLGEKVLSISHENESKKIITHKNSYTANLIINCGGLYSDHLAKLDGLKPSIAIIPFRGEYFLLKPEEKGLIRNLIYPVPDPAFPFLGVHFTRMIDGSTECGPNAVLAMKREGYRKMDFSFSELTAVLLNAGFRKLALRYWKMGLTEIHRSFSKAAFVKALQKLVPAIQADMLTSAEAGVRAQALHTDGSLVDDFYFQEGERSLHVLNAPSPAATASLAIADEIVKRIICRWPEIN